jgi:hypothetical protein
MPPAVKNLAVSACGMKNSLVAGCYANILSVVTFDVKFL